VGRAFGDVCAATHSLHVLLAALLLAFDARTGMRSIAEASVRTSNDLLRELAAKQTTVALNYQIVAQSVEDVRNVDNAPAVSVAPYLIESGQTRLLTTISIYSLRGENRDQVRLLYMNAAALRVWKEMGKVPTVIGSKSRPPHAALLAFGVPFSE
jgi:hypothetical protein